MMKNLLVMFAAAAAMGASSMASAETVPVEDFSLNFEEVRMAKTKPGAKRGLKIRKRGSSKMLKIRPQDQKKGGLDRDIIRRKW